MVDTRQLLLVWWLFVCIRNEFCTYFMPLW